jgi:hypothetical protein
VYNTDNTSIAAGCFIISKRNNPTTIISFFNEFRLINVIRSRKILGNTGYTSIADTGRFWKILVIPVLQILEDSGKYWLYQYCRYWKILENTGHTSRRYWDTSIYQYLYQYCRYW